MSIATRVKPNTLSAERNGTHSVDVAGELAKLGTDGYRPLRTASAAAGRETG